MRRIWVYIGLVMFLFSACAGNKDKLSPDYVFALSDVEPLSKTGLLENKEVINLELSDSTLVRTASSLIMSDRNFYVYSMGASYPVLSFDRSGHFCGNVGNIGSGPGEYAAVYDVDVDEAGNGVEVLSNAAILKYSTGNEFISNSAPVVCVDTPV